MNTKTFSAGIDPATYIQTIRNYRSFAKSLAEVASADPSHVDALRDAVSRHPGPVRATIMTEDWCGDSACNTPMVASLCEAAGIELRILRGSETPELKAFIETDSSVHPPTDHIPVVSIWDGEFNEIARWIEAPAAVDKKKAEWKSKQPNFMKLYEDRQSGPDAAKAFATVYRGLLEEMGRWYRDGMWKETTREIVESVAAATPASTKGSAD
jgi:hypothetical protein